MAVNYVLFGMKHCGKSTLGRLLAERAGATFVDTDDRLEQLHAVRTGETLHFREIFKAHGPEYFAELETQAITELADEVRANPQQAYVVGLGGRSPLQPALQPVIERIGLTVYLRVPKDDIFDRIMAGGLPPFLDAADPRGSFDVLFADREPKYRAFAQVTADLEGQATAEQNTDRLWNALQAFRS